MMELSLFRSSGMALEWRWLLELGERDKDAFKPSRELMGFFEALSPSSVADEFSAQLAQHMPAECESIRTAAASVQPEKVEQALSLSLSLSRLHSSF